MDKEAKLWKDAYQILLEHRNVLLSRWIEQDKELTELRSKLERNSCGQ